MRRKVLQDLANTLCHMLVSSRSAKDLEALAALPDGSLILDLLRSRATHDVVGELALHITAELSSWLRTRLDDLSIPLTALAEVQLIAKFQTDRIPTNRKKVVSFDWTCESVLRTDEHAYVGRAVEKHVWHQRSAT